jgi:hypothetical protein
MGSATTGAALFLTRLVVSAQAFRLDHVVILSVLGKNIVQPALCLLLAIPCGFLGVGRLDNVDNVRLAEDGGLPKANIRLLKVAKIFDFLATFKVHP